MKTKLIIPLALLGLAIVSPWPSSVFAQGAAFTYQGHLNDGAGPANGSYDLRLSVHQTAVGGGLIAEQFVPALMVSNGLFTVTVDFSTEAFPGADRWLETGVRTNGGMVYTVLTPRQKITAAPYAITAGTLNGVVLSTNLSGTYGRAVTMTNGANQFTGNFTGNGNALLNVNATTLGGFNSSDFWRLDGNLSTTPGVHYLGTATNQPLELKVNASRALRLEPTASTPNLVAGHAVNGISTNSAGSVIGGGGGTGLPYLPPTANKISGNFAVIGGGVGNNAATNLATIGGGLHNSIFNSEAGFIGGGSDNQITGGNHSSIQGGLNNFIRARTATIGGGSGNEIRTNAYDSTIGGGSFNFVGDNATWATVGGGTVNYIYAGAPSATISGGQLNEIRGDSTGATVGGGSQNRITNANDATIAGGVNNVVHSRWAAIGGGRNNFVFNNSQTAAIGGGEGNEIRTNAYEATIAGGSANFIGDNSFYGSVGGGSVNHISAGAYASTIGGGQINEIQDDSAGSTVSGGDRNLIEARSPYSAIGGGHANSIRTNSYAAAMLGGTDNVIEPGANFSLIGAGYANEVHSNATHAVVIGGRQNTIEATADFAAIGGGDRNLIGEGSNGSTIGGGIGNRIEGDTRPGLYFEGCTIGGGSVNSIGAGNSDCLIAGGNGNDIGTAADFATIGGGRDNEINTNAVYATIGGGFVNSVSGIWATVPGGYNNRAAGHNSFAAGHRAKADHDGSFVWGDLTSANIASSGTNQFVARASGGYSLFSNPGATIGVSLAPGSGSWTALSDRNAKENFSPVNGREILDRVSQLPIQTWNYKSQDPVVRHLGPTAQDFKAAFGLGETERGITTVDADGVALASIQGLNQKVEEQAAELRNKDAELRAVKERLSDLEKVMTKLAGALAQPRSQ